MDMKFAHPPISAYQSDMLAMLDERRIAINLSPRLKLEEGKTRVEKVLKLERELELAEPFYNQQLEKLLGAKAEELIASIAKVIEAGGYKRASVDPSANPNVNGRIDEMNITIAKLEKDYAERERADYLSESIKYADLKPLQRHSDETREIETRDIIKRFTTAGDVKLDDQTLEAYVHLRTVLCKASKVASAATGGLFPSGNDIADKRLKNSLEANTRAMMMGITGLRGCRASVGEDVENFTKAVTQKAAEIAGVSPAVGKGRG
ncbi:MAG: hypothetical protein ACOYNL_10205 [Rickettsiales bacterium]